jgi:hypothetical protein
MSLPNPSMSFTPFDILTAEELNDLVENIEALSDGTGFEPGAVPVLRAIRYYTANDTWSKPANMQNSGFVRVIVVGGGGGSGGQPATAAGQVGISGGGGGGGASIKKIAAASLGATVTVTVGAAGTAGASGANAGGTGGTSSFGAHCSATGGVGGGAGVADSSTNATSSSAGGAGSGGDLNLAGGYSNPGRILATGVVSYPHGGDAALGMGQGGASAVNSIAVADGVLYGGGAAGWAKSGSQSAAAGRAGAAGIVIVEEWY